MRSTYKSDLGWAAVHSLCLNVLKIIGSKSFLRIFAGSTDGERILSGDEERFWIVYLALEQKLDMPMLTPSMETAPGIDPSGLNVSARAHTS